MPLIHTRLSPSESFKTTQKSVAHVVCECVLTEQTHIPASSARGAMLATNVHSAPALRMNIALLLIRLYGLMAWAGTNIPFLYDSQNKHKLFP